MISYEASPLVRDHSGKTALDLAISPEIQRILVEPPRTTESPSTFAPTSPNLDQDGEDTDPNEEDPVTMGFPEPEDLTDQEILDKSAGHPAQLLEVDLTKQRHISFGIGSKSEYNPVLLTWLASIKLEEIYDTLLSAGYDDIEMMSEQMQSHMPITTDTLRNIGVKKPGHRARLLAHLMNDNTPVPGK